MIHIGLAFTYLKSVVSTLLAREDAQDTFEYILIIGAISVAVVVAVVAFKPDSLVQAACMAVKGIGATFSTITCPFPPA
jgi:hypothetical protein